jgi:hypothetical protein
MSPAVVDTTRCAVMLCVGRPKGLVRAQVYLAPGDATPSIREVPMCEGCADDVGERFNKGERLHLTPGGALYVGDLQQLIPRRWRP